MKEIKLYTDGACSGNPGPGGWACILKYNEHEKRLCGASAKTTNNAMELLAVINGFKALKEHCKVEVVSDSKYVTEAFNQHWIYNWVKQGFEGRRNGDLWQELLSLVQKHDVKFTWIKGHAGHKYNELCDKMAVQAYQELMQNI